MGFSWRITIDTRILRLCIHFNPLFALDCKTLKRSAHKIWTELKVKHQQIIKNAYNN